MEKEVWASAAAEYRYCHERLKELDDALQEWRAKYENVGAINYDKIPSEPKNNDQMLYCLIYKAELEEEARKLHMRRHALRPKVEAEISQKVITFPHDSIARRYYIDGQTKGQIAYAVGYSYQHTDRLLHRVNEMLGIEISAPQDSKCSKM
jgi:hypothetical protein